MPLLAWGRRVVFVALVIFIVGGPFYLQVLHGRSRVLRPWRMYSTKGIDACRVAFRQRDSTGMEAPIARLEAMGYRSWQAAPPNHRLITRVSQAQRQGQLLCRRLGPNADVRMYLECGKKPARWVRKAWGETNLCRR